MYKRQLEKLRVNPQLHTINPDDLQDLGTIGDGNFSTVHKMKKKEDQKIIAVKRVNLQNIKSSHDSGEDMKQIRELSVALKLAAKKCPYIVDFFGYCLRDGDVWICMELMDFSLEAVKKHVYEVKKTVIPEEIVGKICSAVLMALHYLQKELNVMHRDIKPSNIVMNWNGDIKLCDFGLTGQLINSIAKTKEIGCRPYMAPERIDPLRPSEGYTVRADVWSFGITMYELAVGEFPYSKWQTIFDQLNEVVNGPPPKLPSNRNFSEGFVELIETCLVKNADERPKYDQILEMAFIKKSKSAQVDVAAWLKTVMPLS